MEPIGIAAGITTLAVVAVVVATAMIVVAAARREQNRNEQQITEVRGVIGRVAPINVSVDGDQDAPTRRRGETGGEWAYRSQQQTEDAERADQRLLDGLAKRTSVRFEIQQAHYANALRQSTTYFYYSLGVGVAGFALLLAGVGLALADLMQVGTVAALGGLLADAAAALVFSQANRAKADAQTNLSSIAHAAEKDENSLMAYIYASRIEDVAMRDATNAALARRMAGSTDGIAVSPTDTPISGIDRPTTG